ncbi:uncharacterized protein K452DRAFT_276837 [Aplosporella prunicola CBS 121167]|uniref:Ubiquitin-like domain-containing protein n=1 Tax=Aplosporella prunicola CBS 121167 TaxID=1176127 RepID=A0A6A6B2N4_9PEZI|nr:uncharacterized protein K452DRAFT_276837 [Aplosporella prunicola CBS 121167]KAF2138449.1 hypothetical protein K452DRAFT_276837 [Aplosporella prunicola CBS 121167]
MSFGFSTGDIIAVGKLVADVVKSLQDSGGAKSDYQELLRELECLEQALLHLDRLQATSGTSTRDLDSIKHAALSCRYPLEAFLAKMRKYNDTLGLRPKKGALIRTNAAKLRWSLGKKEEVAKLQAYLSVHLGTINVLLSEYELEALGALSQKTEGFHMHVRATLDGVRKVVDITAGNINAQSRLVGANNSMLTTLYQLVCGELSTSFKSLLNMVSTVCLTTQQIYSVVLEIKSSLSGPDTRWTFFQDPYQVEDALGFTFPIPSEYDFHLINVIIKARFRNGPGSEYVRLGMYELLQTRDTSQAISEGTFLRPGTKIKMAIIIEMPYFGWMTATCLIPKNFSRRNTVVPGRGRIWCVIPDR